MLVASLDGKLFDCRQIVNQFDAEIFAVTEILVFGIVVCQLLYTLFTVVVCLDGVVISLDTRYILNTFIPEVVFERKPRYNGMAVPGESGTVKRLAFSGALVFRILRFVAVKAAPGENVVLRERVVKILGSYNRLVFAFNVRCPTHRNFAKGGIRFANNLFVPAVVISMARINDSLSAEGVAE